MLSTITTPRLLLRPVQPDDGPTLYALINNWAVIRWLSVVPWPYTPDDMSWFITNIAGPRAATDDPIFALLLDGTTLIGVAECMGGADAGSSEVEVHDLGFWLGEPYWGKGYMSEAVSALITRAFERPETEVIRSGAFEGNDRSLAVHEKLGFVRTGLRPSHCRARATDIPLATLRLTRERFKPV
ncbi:MAG: GNAT family N-acetyltransferase [Hyphomicrobiaceae bacterium]